MVVGVRRGLDRQREQELAYTLNSLRQEIPGTALGISGLPDIIMQEHEKYLHSAHYINFSNKYLHSIKRLKCAEHLSRVVWEPYFNAIRDNVLAKARHGRQLSNLYKDRDSVMAELTGSCVFLLHKYAKGYIVRAPDPESVLQEGFQGLYRATFKWDGRTKFSYYAKNWMQVHMEREALRQSTGLEIGGANVKKLRSLKGRYSIPLVLSEIDCKTGTSRIDLAAKEYPLEDLLIKKEVDMIVQGCVNRLEYKRSTCISMSDEIGCGHHTYEQIGRLLNVSRERVRQLRKDGMKRLKKMPRMRKALELIK
jgi:RNA polymerase sigma factor (sigma-70 family)